MKKIFYALLAVSVIFSACKKEEEKTTPTILTPNNGGNNNTNSDILGTWDLIEYTVHTEEGYYTNYPDPTSRVVTMGDIETLYLYEMGFEDYALRFASNDTLEAIYTVFGGMQYNNFGSWDLNGDDLSMTFDAITSDYTITELNSSSLAYSLGLNEDTWTSSSSDVNCEVYVSDGDYPSEVSWMIVDQGGNYIGGGTPGSQILPLTDGICYDMVMIDEYGDGWDGAEYTITNVDDNIVLSTGTLITGYQGSENFCVTSSGGGGGGDNTYFSSTETIHHYNKVNVAPGISNARIQKENKAIIIEEKNK